MFNGASPLQVHRSQVVARSDISLTVSTRQPTNCLVPKNQNKWASSFAVHPRFAPRDEEQGITLDEHHRLTLDTRVRPTDSPRSCPLLLIRDRLATRLQGLLTPCRWDEFRLDQALLRKPERAYGPLI